MARIGPDLTHPDSCYVLYQDKKMPLFSAALPAWHQNTL
jgi:hypothetical protein